VRFFRGSGTHNTHYKSAVLNAMVFAPDTAFRFHGQAARIYHFCCFLLFSSHLLLPAQTVALSAAMQSRGPFSFVSLPLNEKGSFNSDKGLCAFMEKIPTWIERLLLPKLNEITGEIKALHTRIDSVEKEITSLRSES
jgi:hypothetical protein